MYVDINAGVSKTNTENLVLFTLSHELVHYIRDWSPAKFKVLSDFVINEFMANKVDVEGYISKKVNVLKGDKEYQGKTQSELRKIAYEELVAESCQRMLVDSKAIEKLAKKDKGLFNKLKQFITDFFNKIVARYKKLTPTSAEARLVQEIKGMSEKLQSLFEDALLDAAENHRIVGTQKNTAQGGVKMQLREMGLDEFSKQTKNNIKMRNGVLVENMSELKQHIQLALTTDSKSNLYFGAITDDVKNKIENDVKSRVFQDKQYSFVVSYDDIIHISKHFGTEPDVVAQEVLRLYDIVKNYDDVKLEITKHGTKKLIFEKSYSDYDYRSIEIASNKKATLDLVSFYITKNNIKRKGNQSVPPATQNSSSQWGSVSSNNSIPNETESVNTKFQLKSKESAYEEAMQEYQQTHSIESVKKMVALVDEFAERSMPDSKVRDKNGKLMKVYHGTEADDFNVFDKARRGQTDSSLWGRGYYFSSDYEFAEMFGDNVRSFFLNITNPFTVSKVDAPASEIADKLIALGEKIDFDYSKFKALEFAKAFGNQKFTDVLLSHGYDGVMIGDFEYVAFDRNQMKLSDPITYDDNGKVIPLSERFDDSKVDIRFQKKVDSDAELTDNKSINNGGAVNGSQNTKLLGRREISADGGNYDPIWQQSESARKILGYLGLLSEEKKRNENENRASDSRWLAPSSYMQQIEQGFANGILRDLRGVKLSGRDVIGRTLSPEVLDKLKDTIFKDENGNVIPLYHWTQNTFLEFRYGDIGFHFGTVDAAHDRYIQLKRDRADKGLETPLGKYKEVYLNIKNPLTLIDWNYQWTAGDVAMQLSDKGLITENQYNNLALTSGFYDWSYDNPAAKAVRKILSDLGYDGIIYYNQSEDIGSISAIALYPEQVIMVTDNGIPVNQNSNSNELETKNGLPDGVIKYQYKAYAVETDTELLAQHLEENSELVSEVLRRSAKIEMKDGTMRRLVDRRLRYYGIGRELRKETAEYISAVFVAAGHPSAKGKDLTADITSTIKSALEKSSFEYNSTVKEFLLTNPIDYMLR